MLYIYNNSGVGDIAGMGAVTQMMVSNRSDFAGATWEPYQRDRAWTLESGSGWRSVYVRKIDSLGRGTTVSDSIYLGAESAVTSLGFAQMSATQSSVRVPGLNSQHLPQVMLSLGWMADDQNFSKLWGNVERVNDAQAIGGTAMRLSSGDPSVTESGAWVTTTVFHHDIPLVAFVRLKTSDNTSSQNLARLDIKGGGTYYGLLDIKGTDFLSPNTYQEFALPFIFNSNATDPFLSFEFFNSGQPDVFLDGVSIFTTPMPASTTTWNVPEQHYRDEALWIRYTDGAGYYTASQTAFVVPADTTAPTVTVTTPATGTGVKTLPSISGSALDNTGGSGVARVVLYLRRNSDSLWWTGTAWGTTTPTPLTTTLSGTSWTRNTALPTGTNLVAGSYYTFAYSFDKATNRSVPATSTFTVSSTEGRNVSPAASDASSAGLSSASAGAANDSITLAFTGSLDIDAASDVSRYGVTVNGVAATVAGTSLTGGDVTLSLEAGALHASDAVIVSYDLRDAKGKTIIGEARIAAN